MTISIREFQNIIWAHYAQEGRSFPWRYIDDPYKILISEIMLQQTQTYRVIEKYCEFLQAFPTVQALASAPSKEVLRAWQGLGYNRRGMYVHKTAQKIASEYNGIVPQDPAILVTFPGIGKATAASISAFAYNTPTIFIETNIRTVFIYFFFPDKEDIHDNDILPIIAETLDRENSRDWYYALMDYGVMLKKKLPNPSRKSIHHQKQSKFEGSDRQIRGMILRALTNVNVELSELELLQKIDKDPIKIKSILLQMIAEGLIKKDSNTLYL